MFTKVKISSFEKLLSYVGYILKNWIILSLFIAFKPLKIPHSPSKGLSTNREVLPIQVKPDVLVWKTREYLALSGLTQFEGNSYPFSLVISQLSRTFVGPLKTPLLGDFLIPPWNPSILGWIQLPKDQRL
jgi:hypothetical protein